MKPGATSYKDTAFGIIPHNRLVKLEIEGTKKGLEWLHKKIKAGGFVVTPELIKTLHKKSFGWIFPKWAGKFRTIQVTYSGKEAPKYYQLPELMVNLCRDLNEMLTHLPKPGTSFYLDEVIKFLAWWQHRFVLIHPFNDYNGRTARMLTNLILLELNLPSLEIKAETGKDRKTYIKALQWADKGEYVLLEKLVAEALAEALGKYQ
ncbi:MAG: Helicase-like protein [Candidatus Beckwithbacteria bacterium GW2011_GWA2_43_10]|uniref:Helicase-like protein n=1 Tax=Candidatus Beckwithbacteria bacterium GW2011_GWA2_43_10 TaxID=1618369 RepID=A0A0G1C528_9BACT|nr:MAG: Helicase-like protein [Candidatus Beckwithbacteria bacterium GW2011_GWA2_43_10]